MWKIKIIIGCFILLPLAANAQWSQLNSGTSLNLNSVYFLNNNLGWVCGDEGIILKTTDGGESWTQIITSNLINLRAVTFLDTLNGAVAGSKASIYKTTNGGNSWDLRNLNPDLNFNDITYITTYKILAVGDGGLMLLSADNGNNWQNISNPSQNDLMNISFLNENYGWVGGDNYIRKTTDGGTSWTNNYFSNQHDNYVFIFSENLIFRCWFEWWGPYLLDPGVNIQKTTNLGTSWIYQYSAINTSNSIYFCTALTGYALIGNYKLIFTINSGNQWVDNFTHSALNDFCFIDSTTGWIVGDGGYIAKTINAGGFIPVELISFSGKIVQNKVILNWSTATETNNHGFEIQRKTDNTNWATIGFKEGKGTTTKPQSYSYTDLPAGKAGKNLQPGKYSYRLKQVDFDGTYKFSDVVEVEVAPSSFSLSQNYPNPFNPITNIEYRIPDKEYVTLKVYDVLGNEVATLVNEEKPAGSYTVQFSAKGDFASGVYFYQLRGGSYKASKKLILLK